MERKKALAANYLYCDSPRHPIRTRPNFVLGLFLIHDFRCISFCSVRSFQQKNEREEKPAVDWPFPAISSFMALSFDRLLIIIIFFFCIILRWMNWEVWYMQYGNRLLHNLTCMNVTRTNWITNKNSWKNDELLFSKTDELNIHCCLLLLLLFLRLESRLSLSKELPTTKWRRDRRIRLSSEYHHNHEPTTVANGGTNIKPLGESNQTNGCGSISNGISGDNNMEIPLDMSVTSAAKPPPPPYREPLPGSQFSTIAARPSVITQAPKREILSNQENNNGSLNKTNNNFGVVSNAPAEGMLSQFPSFFLLRKCDRN